MPPKSDPASSADDRNDTEADMRRALGLDRVARGQHRPSQHAGDRPKRRFAQDGDVPVVRREQGMHGGDYHVATGSSPSNRIEIAEAAIKSEREVRERTERSLVEAQAIIRDMQTKLGHATLAVDEMRAALGRATNEKHAAEVALAAECDARQAAEKALQQATAKRSASEDRGRRQMTPPEPSTTVTASVEKSSVKPVRTKAPAKASPRLKSTGPKPKPVKWWIKPGKAPARPA